MCRALDVAHTGKSRALPAFTIHTAVKQAKKAFDKSSNPRLRAWGPTVTGLAIVPALPYIFDHPVEVATDHAFEWIEQRLAKTDKDSGSNVD
jgi:mitochondrial fission process protein 1